MDAIVPTVGPKEGLLDSSFPENPAAGQARGVSLDKALPNCIVINRPEDMLVLHGSRPGDARKQHRNNLGLAYYLVRRPRPPRVRHSRRNGQAEVPGRCPPLQEGRPHRRATRVAGSICEHADWHDLVGQRDQPWTGSCHVGLESLAPRHQGLQHSCKGAALFGVLDLVSQCKPTG